MAHVGKEVEGSFLEATVGRTVGGRWGGDGRIISQVEESPDLA